MSSIFFHPYLSGVPIAISWITVDLLNQFIFPATSHDKEDVTLLQPKDPPVYSAQESRMWSSPRTSRFPFTHMAPPAPSVQPPSFWQPAKRSAASGSTKAVLCRVTQAYFMGNTTTTESSPWKWTVSEKWRLCSRKSVTPPGGFKRCGFKTSKREPVISKVGA